MSASGNQTNFATAGDGTRIAFDQTGTGPPLVLIHGITQCRQMFDPLIAALSASHRVIAVDLRGHGESDAADDYAFATMAGDIAAVIDHAGVSDVDVVGHSLGGVVATAFASLYEPRRVINIDQPLALTEFKAHVGALEPLLRGPEFEATMTAVLDAIMGEHISDAERARITSLQAPVRQTVLALWDPLLTGSDDDLAALVAELLGGVTAPYLSLHGVDPGADYGAWLSAQIASATVEVWDGLGHYPHLVEPARFVDRLAGFLA